jgi:prolyl 4-hydroxylase
MAHFTLTPEAKNWIISRKLAGCSADAVVQELVAAGWQRKIAIDALKIALAPGAKMDIATSVPTTSKVRTAGADVDRPVPEPNLLNSPLTVDAGDRQVRVLLAMKQPRIVVFGDLLSAAECDGLIAEAASRLQRSQTLDPQKGGEQVDPARTSNGMFFTRGESELTQRIEARIAKLLNWPVENGEGLQVLHYEPGAQYEPHYDYFDPEAPGTPAVLKHGGQRVASLIMYLSSPERGGATTFSDIGFDVAPQRGNAVFFSYSRPHPSTQTMHGGAPVLAGEKWIATKWLRERVFG